MELTSLPAIADYSRASQLRAQATRLRHLADELTREARVLEAEAFPDPLKGREIAAVAAEVLRDLGPMHYKQLTPVVEERAGRHIRGQDPTATLLASLSRSPNVRQAGRGIYAVEDREGIHA